MEGMREIAIAYYERAPQEEKDEFQEFFSAVDANGDGNISLTEFKTPFESESSVQLSQIEGLFNLVDANGNGKLDSVEALTLYFILAKAKLRGCDGCSCLLAGPYFSCLMCLGKVSYDLCCGCYRGGKSDCLEHSAQFMMDHHSMLEVLRERSVQAQTSKNSAIEELREIAKSYYEASSTQVHTLAYRFFKSMDTDGDDKVNLEEFLRFMKQEGYAQMRSTSFFTELDQNGDGKLDFSEVMTLYYIIKSGRPFCDECQKFIPGTYFSCVQCFNRVGYSSFTLCLNCHGSPSARSKHTHNGPAQFLDNYTLHKATNDSALALTKSTTITRKNQHHDKDEWSDALHAFELAFNVGSTAATMCTIM